MSTPDLFDFDLLPPDPGVISLDLTLDAALAPVEELPSDAPIPLGKGWHFDFLAGQFTRSGASPQETYDADTLVVWVEKCLRTARYAHPIYSDSYGMEDPFRLVGNIVDEGDLSGYQEAIVEALLVHDRITAVEDFSFAQDPFEETLYASFTVVLDEALPLQPQTIEFTDVPVIS